MADDNTPAKAPLDWPLKNFCLKDPMPVIRVAPNPQWNDPMPVLSGSSETAVRAAPMPEYRPKSGATGYACSNVENPHDNKRPNVEPAQGQKTPFQGK